MSGPDIIKDAGARTFEYAAPLILVGTVAAVWHSYGLVAAGALTIGYLIAAGLAWRAAWIAYRRGTRQ